MSISNSYLSANEVLGVTKLPGDDCAPDSEGVPVHEYHVRRLAHFQSAHLVVNSGYSSRVGRNHADGIGKGDLWAIAF